VAPPRKMDSVPLAWSVRRAAPAPKECCQRGAGGSHGEGRTAGMERGRGVQTALPDATVLARGTFAAVVLDGLVQVVATAFGNGDVRLLVTERLALHEPVGEPRRRARETDELGEPAHADVPDP